MGLDAFGIFFYGMVIPYSSVKMLKERDENAHDYQCTICSTEMNTPFCPKDGGLGKQLMHKPGFNEFRDLDFDNSDKRNESKYAEGGVVLKDCDWNDDNTYYLCDETSFKITGSHRRDHAIPAPLGTNIISGINQDRIHKAIERICKDFDIPYQTPQFHFGMHLSY